MLFFIDKQKKPGSFTAYPTFYHINHQSDNVVMYFFQSFPGMLSSAHWKAFRYFPLGNLCLIPRIYPRQNYDMAEYESVSHLAKSLQILQSQIFCRF